MPKSIKCTKLDCNNPHDVLLHGAERTYPAKDSTKSPAVKTVEVKTVEGTYAKHVLLVKGLLQTVALKLSSISTCSKILFFVIQLAVTH